MSTVWHALLLGGGAAVVVVVALRWLMQVLIQGAQANIERRTSGFRGCDDKRRPSRKDELIDACKSAYVRGADARVVSASTGTWPDPAVTERSDPSPRTYDVDDLDHDVALVLVGERPERLADEWVRPYVAARRPRAGPPDGMLTKGERR